MNDAGIAGLLRAIHEADIQAVASVEAALPSIELAVYKIADRLRAGGRWFNVGAGTSGRLGALDAAELPPTFGVPSELVTSLLAGGREAMWRAIEGAEDDREAGSADLRAAGMTGRDVVVGIAASGATPYVMGAVEFARQESALTISIVCKPGTPLASMAEIAIVLDVGEEVLSGSSRMKAGTAQKCALNMLSTAVMAQRGLVYKGEMVAMRPTNAKLKRRAVRIVCDLLKKPVEDAQSLLERAGWELPVALVMGTFGVGAEKARARLAGRSIAEVLSCVG